MKLTSKLKIALKSILSIQLAEVVTDKETLIFDGELAEGIEVFVRDENAEDGLKPAENGTYESETHIIEITDGKITKIEEKQKEETPAEEQPVENEETPAEEHPEEEAADEAPADEQPSVEDRLTALESILNELKPALEQILNGLAGLEGRIEALEEKVNKLDETPADEPADDETHVEETQHTKAYYLRKNK